VEVNQRDGVFEIVWKSPAGRSKHSRIARAHARTLTVGHVVVNVAEGIRLRGDTGVRFLGGNRRITPGRSRPGWRRGLAGAAQVERQHAAGVDAVRA
jgi:hypothetical protein